MTYTVKEIFYTLQGEGGQAGRAAVFCRSQLQLQLQLRPTSIDVW